MNPECKAARLRLKQSTRSEYNALVYEAKLTPEQEEILNRHILRSETIVKIADALHCSEFHVKKSLQKSYIKVSKVKSASK
jgi:DNA-binding NarL/FixJ family response regulator